MSLTLVCLHGFTQNGAQLAAQLSDLTAKFPGSADVVCPDAPHACSEDSVQRMAAAFPALEHKPPHLRWWDASDDGKEYQDWELTREQLRELCDRRGSVGLLGFSQGAIACAALAALHAAGEFPALEFAIMIAGSMPRSDLLAPLFQQPIALPSLHIWGEDDTGTRESSTRLSEAFAAETREVVVWKGGHTIPTTGPAADAIIERVNRES